MTKIKICGITKAAETAYLNAAGVDYAGFVFYEKSRRNVSIEKAKELMGWLDASIQKVAVTVSADAAQALALQEAGFDVLQIHGQLRQETLQAVEIPVWYAVNIADPNELEEKSGMLLALPEALQNKITAIVVDNASYGSGQTFDWNRIALREQNKALFRKRMFILAGGLCADNVRDGIRWFAPDVVDVSSGVEGQDGKDGTKITQFCNCVRTIEEKGENDE